MEKITMLQNATLVVGGTFVIAKGMESVWNDRLIKQFSHAFSLVGMVIGVIAIAVGILGQMMTLSKQQPYSTSTERGNEKFSHWLKDGTTLAFVSGAGLTLI